MRGSTLSLALGLLACTLGVWGGCDIGNRETTTRVVDLGDRPHYLVSQMKESPLKTRLQACSEGPFRQTSFTIGHRGAPLRYPEHTKESYEAAARMGAGLIECDVTFTRDQELVCRHSQCDLHTTTNILRIPELAERCSQPFTPADPETGTLATALCCTSDISLVEFERLCGRMDVHDPSATTLEAYLAPGVSGAPDPDGLCGTLMTHRESIALIDALGADFTPELKTPMIPMPFEDRYAHEAFARAMIADYRTAGIDPARVWAQSFELRDLQQWIDEEPEFARQAVLLDDRMFRGPEFVASEQDMRSLAELGVRTVAPPIWALLTLDERGAIVPSGYARAARGAGLAIVAWTLERSGSLREGGGWYYQSITDAIEREGDVYEVLHVLAEEVGIRSVFSDWAATATYYANCMGID